MSASAMSLPCPQRTTCGSIYADKLEDAFVPLEQEGGDATKNGWLPRPCIEPLEETVGDDHADPTVLCCLSTSLTHYVHIFTAEVAPTSPHHRPSICCDLPDSVPPG